MSGTGGTAGLVLTLAENGQQGTFIIDPVVTEPVRDFTATWMARVGGGTDTPADGWSLSMAPGIPDGEFGEDGTGSGLVVSFDTYDNGNGEAPVSMSATPASWWRLANSRSACCAPERISPRSTCESIGTGPWILSMVRTRSIGLCQCPDGNPSPARAGSLSERGRAG